VLSALQEKQPKIYQNQTQSFRHKFRPMSRPQQ
jgi:hypothetical protein